MEKKFICPLTKQELTIKLETARKMLGRIFSLVFCLVFLVGCTKTKIIPIDKLDGKVVLLKEQAYCQHLEFITVRDSIKIESYYLYKHDSENLKVGDTIKIK